MPDIRPATGIPLKVVGDLTFSATEDAVKWMPDSVPSKISFLASSEEAKGTMYFAAQPAVVLADSSYRPSGKNEPREVKFLLTKAELPLKLPAATNKVVLATPGNYLVLQPHAIYSMYGFAVRKKDVAVAKAFDQILSKLPAKGMVVCVWSEKKLDFIVYDQSQNVIPEYRGSVSFVENVAELTTKVHGLVAGYYWTTSAKFSRTTSEREQLKGLAATVLPREVVEEYAEGK